MSVNGGSNVPNLGALKGRAEARDQFMAQFLAQQGAVCKCGTRIGEGGVQLLTVEDVMTPSPEGMVPSVKVDISVYCSDDCVAYREQYGDGSTAIFKRDVPAITWLDGE